MAPHFVELICEPRERKIRPRTPTHARASLPFALAAALHAGALGPEHYSPRAIGDPAVLALAGKVCWTLDPSPPPATQYKGAVTIETVDGRRESAEIAHNRGSRENPMTREEIVAKFDACARSLSSRRRRGTIERVLALETAGSIEEVLRECA